MKLPNVFNLARNSEESRQPKSSSRVIRWISIGLAVFLLYLALRELDWQSFFLTLRKANYAYLPLMFLWSSFSYLVRALRWQVLLNKEKKIFLLNVFWANMVGYLGNTILPARAGELVRAAYVGKTANIPISFALATGLTERLLDVIALVVLGALSLLSTGHLSPTLEAGLKAMGLVSIAGLATVLLMPRFANGIKNGLEKLPLLSDTQKERVDRIVQGFLTGFASLSSLKRATFFIVLTAAIWLMDAAGTVLISRMFALALTLPQAFILLAALGLSSAIPSTPGYVGVYQFAAVFALKPFGFSNADAVALVLFGQIMNLVVVGIWGTIAAGRFSRAARESVHG